MELSGGWAPDVCRAHGGTLHQCLWGSPGGPQHSTTPHQVRNNLTWQHWAMDWALAPVEATGQGARRQQEARRGSYPNQEQEEGVEGWRHQGAWCLPRHDGLTVGGWGASAVASLGMTLGEHQISLGWTGVQLPDAATGAPPRQPPPARSIGKAKP